MFWKARLAIVIILAVILFLSGGSGARPAQTGYFPSVSLVSASAAESAAVPALAASTPLPVTSIAAGLEHTCALINGVVECWGSNRQSQLGPATPTIHPFPIKVAISGMVTEITAGAFHTCALIGGSVYCWGLNFHGQLGTGNTTNSATPQQVAGLSGIQHVIAGYGYTCAMATGAVWCWGENTYGQLGTGPASSTPVTTPTLISGLTTANQISAGYDHTCALLAAGTVQCWGRNNYGQLGYTGNDSPTPVGVVGLPAGVTAIAAGAQHTCALTSSKTVWCWGDGLLGQMGNGKNLQVNSTPVQVTGVVTAAAITAGGYSDTGHTCALTTGAGVVCWGSNALGQLGNGTTNDQNIPATVAGLANVTQVAAGVNHTCALLSNSTVQCWGSDSSGQLGDGVDSMSSLPVIVSGATGATLLGSGEQNTCGLVNNNVMCWGNNRGGQLGDLTLTNRSAPTAVQIPGLTAPVTAIDSGLKMTCAIANGALICWGTAFTAPVTLAASGVTSLSVTNQHGCAVVNGAARCWGDNSRGQLGNGNQVNSPSALVPVAGMSGGVQSVATGQWFSCALLASGQVWCWGDDTNGQVGDGLVNANPQLQPKQVQGMPALTALTAGEDHACAQTSAGSMYCWGNDRQGQLGDGSRSLTPLPPVLVSGLTNGVTQITAGGFHTCALVNTGVKCWGLNNLGQLGNGQTTDSEVPVTVSGLSAGVLVVNAGGLISDEEHTCAINNLHVVMCWGGDKYGQLGDNLPILRLAPVHVLGLANGPEIGQNYTTGNVRSNFRFATANFPQNVPLIITANGNFMGTITTTADGYAVFHVLINNNTVGPIQIQVTDNLSNTVSSTVTISAGAPTRLQEGKGLVYFVNANFLYLPAIFP